MHGTMFFHLHRYAEKTWGHDAWRNLFATAGMTESVYSSTSVYPDEDMVALVHAAAETTGLASFEILQSFGEYLAPELIAIYPGLVDSRWRTLDLICQAETVIHNVVRAHSPDAMPPVLRAQRINDREVHMVYASPRMMCALLKGIAKGVAHHYGEELTFNEESCMLDGAPFCSIIFKRISDGVADGDTVTIHDTDSLSSSHWTGKSDKTRVEEFDSGPPLEDSSFTAEANFPGEHRVGGYQIVNLLGVGGMGRVYLAQDTVLDRWVAVKVLPAEKSSLETRRRFLDEARSMASISHEHIVPIYHVGDDDGTPYIVMPRLIGATLEDWLQEGNRPSVAHALLIVFQTLAGLENAHRQRLLHRDIKPGNIWLEAPKGRVRVMDFGLCLDIGDREFGAGRITASDSLVCTPLYMPPETLKGDSSERSDLYSLGVVLYEMLTGVQPFFGKSVEDVFVKIATHIPPAPGEIVDHVPPSVDRFVMRLMANQPANRPASAKKAMQEVQQLFQEIKGGDALA